MASIANWVIIPVIITSITFIRLGIIIITLINIILLFHKKKIFDNETPKLWGKKKHRWLLNELWGKTFRTDLMAELISLLQFIRPVSLFIWRSLGTVAAVHWLIPWWPRHKSEVRGGGGGLEASNGLMHSKTKHTRTHTHSISAALNPISCSHTSRNWGAADQWPQITNTPHWRPPMD